MDFFKKFDDLFSDKVALPSSILLKSLEILYSSRLRTYELKGIFKRIYESQEKDSVIFKSEEDYFLIKYSIIGVKETFRVSKVIYPARVDIEDSTPYGLEFIDYFDNTVGNLIDVFFKLGIILEYRDFDYFPESITSDIYEHLNNFKTLYKIK